MNLRTPDYCSCLLATLLLSTAFAQSPSGNFDRLQLSVDETATVGAFRTAPPRTRDFVVQHDGLDQLARLSAEDGKQRLNLPANRTLELPLKLDTLVARKSRTVLQYGDALMQMHPLRTDLFWIDAKGAIAAQVRNTYDGAAAIDMADDGHVAVAARGYFDKHSRDDAKRATRVDLYTPDARKIFGATLPNDRKVAHLRAFSGGGGALLVSVPAAKPLVDNRILVLRVKAAQAEIAHRFGVVQKIAVLEGATRAFVQGTEGWGMLDLTRNRLLWEKRGKIRQISPRGAALDAARQRLYLMTGESADAGTLTYRWTLSVLGAEDGAPLGQVKLERPLPSTSLPVFLDAGAQGIAVLTEERRLTVKVAERRSAK